jgi:hypothetical protein
MPKTAAFVASKNTTVINSRQLVKPIKWITLWYLRASVLSLKAANVCYDVVEQQRKRA